MVQTQTIKCFIIRRKNFFKEKEEKPLSSLKNKHLIHGIDFVDSKLGESVCRENCTIYKILSVFRSD